MMRRGFGLIEVLLVLAIVAVLLAVAWPHLAGYECIRYGEPKPATYMKIGDMLVPIDGGARTCLEWRKKEGP